MEIKRATWYRGRAAGLPPANANLTTTTRINTIPHQFLCAPQASYVGDFSTIPISTTQDSGCFHQRAKQIRSDPIRSHPIRSADRNQLERQEPSYQQEWTVNPSLQGTFSVTHATDVTHLQCTDTVPRHHYAKRSQNIAAKAPLAPSYQNRPVQCPTDTLVVLTAANLHVALPHTSLHPPTSGSGLVDSRHNNDVIMITSSPWRHHKTRGSAR